MTLILKPPHKIEKGIYRFEVLKVASGISKKSNEMIVVTMKIYRKGKVYTVTDYFTAEYPQLMIDFFKSANKRNTLKKGFFNTEDFMNSTGLMNVGTLLYKGKTRPKILNYLPYKKPKKTKEKYNEYT